MCAGKHRCACFISIKLATRQGRCLEADPLIAEHRAKLATIDQGVERKRADMAAAQRLVEKCERTLLLITTRAASVAKLADSNLVARSSALELEQERIEAEQDLAAQRATLQSTEAAIQELTEQRTAPHLQAQRSTSQAMEEMEARVRAARQELLKAEIGRVVSATSASLWKARRPRSR